MLLWSLECLHIFVSSVNVEGRIGLTLYNLNTLFGHVKWTCNLSKFKEGETIGNYLVCQQTSCYIILSPSGDFDDSLNSLRSCGYGITVVSTKSANL